MNPDPVRAGIPVCAVCGEAAVFHQREAGRYLCGTHLAAELEHRVSDTIAIRQQIVSAIQLVVHMSRMADGTRKVTSITEITGMEGEIISMQDIFAFDRTGINAAGRVCRVDVRTGETEPWKELRPPDPAGVQSIGPVRVSADAHPATAGLPKRTMCSFVCVAAWFAS